MGSRPAETYCHFPFINERGCKQSLQIHYNTTTLHWVVAYCVIPYAYQRQRAVELARHLAHLCPLRKWRDGYVYVHYPRLHPF